MPILHWYKRLFKYRAVPIDSRFAIQSTVIVVSSLSRASVLTFNRSLLVRFRREMGLSKSQSMNKLNDLGKELGLCFSQGS